MDFLGNEIKNITIPDNCLILYWVRNSKHDDIKSQGYVGITKNVINRFYAHRNCFKDFIKTGITLQQKLHNALVKYENDIVVDFVCMGSSEYISDLEEKLRPCHNTGWNLATGGLNNSRSGRTLTDEEKSHLSKIHSGRDISVEQRKQISESLSGRKLTAEHRYNIKRGLSKIDKNILISAADKGRRVQHELRGVFGEACDLMWNRVNGNLYHTPIGVFININEAARSLNLKSQNSITHRISSKSECFREYFKISKNDPDYEEYLDMFKERVGFDESLMNDYIGVQWTKKRF